MKKIALWMFTALFLFNSAGYFVLFEINRQFIRTEMLGTIRHRSSKPVVLKLIRPEQNRDFRWIKKNEFQYKGEMYDVLSKSVHGAATIFVCVHDTKETKLVAGFKRMNHQKNQLVLPDDRQLYCLEMPSYKLEPHPFFIVLSHELTEILLTTYLSSESPPPKPSCNINAVIAA